MQFRASRRDYAGKTFPPLPLEEADLDVPDTTAAKVQLGHDPQARREAYRALFREALDEAVVTEIRAATNGGFVLGAARF
jgi:hypothetical protein